MGIFTELGILYARYRPEKLMEHLKLFAVRVNIPKLIRVCEEQMHWQELTFLYIQYDEFDNAAMTIINHSPDAWDHMQFKDVAVKVANLEIQYKSITFYLEEHPDLLNDLLNVLKRRIDHSRVVDILRKANSLPLIKPYLIAVQSDDVIAVNEALHELYIEEEDYEKLRESVDHYVNFEQIGLAQQLEEHELLEFRRIAGYIYRKNGRWEQSIALAKMDNLYSDAMDTAAASGSRQLAEDLLYFFVEQGKKECFAACLYTCYDLIRCDVAIELSWVNKMMDCSTPYLLQYLREYTIKIDDLIKDKLDAIKERKELEEHQKEALQQQGNTNNITQM
ncbi:hypothetical protein CBR_g46784 [Chara braunii]|uniref:Clathrin heavy chain linker core motif domain-containing protein n=1 Tax=Chara braunii TaxID=69332 RepID=A0A388M0W2_CHABU|nr:hypothetical protein CBR_g46784 [Chara braunii]|eukprot:GBG88217.1 hypothetical protein CBR_g46784 [Chara braunii]